MPFARVVATALVVSACGGSVEGDRGAAGGSASGGAAGVDSGTPGGGRGSAPEGTEAVVVVDVPWLRSRLDTSDIQLIDARGAPTGGHIPGAVPLNPIEIMDETGPISGQVMPPDRAETVLGALGLRNEATLVVYGGPPEYDPARTVWALRYYGHARTYYLDGGFAAWVAAGGDVASGNPEPTAAGSYVIGSANDAIRVESDYLVSELGAPPHDAVGIQIVDARSTEEYEAGRIPTAVHVPWQETLLDGTFLPRSAHIELYDGLDPEVTTVTYCLVGWRGALAWLSLTELGFVDVRLYDGSWQEWGASSADFPIEP